MIKLYHHKSGVHQHGVALITAVLVLALAVIAATSISFHHQLLMRRVENTLSGDRAWSYQQAAETWAQVILWREIDTLNRVDWPTLERLSDDSGDYFKVITAEKGTIKARLSDEQAKFNINNLLSDGTIDNINKKRMQHLFRLLEVDPNIVHSIIDWIDPDMNPLRSGGAEDLYYNQLEPAYLTAGQNMQDISELRLIKGISAEVYQKLYPYLTALPHGSEINLNTASAEILAALVPDMSIAQAESMVAIREQQSYQHIQDFISQVVLNNMQLKPEGLSVSSNYFALDAEIKVMKSTRKHRSILRHNKQHMTVLRRTTG